MENRKYGAFSSSVDSQKLSLTIKSLVPLLVFALPYFGFVNVGESDLINFIETGGFAASAAFAFYGLARKLWASRV